MHLLEYQGKQLLRHFGVSTAPGELATSKASIARDRFPAWVKAQTRQGGRGKRGLVRKVENSADFDSAVKHMLGQAVDDEVVEYVLVEDDIVCEREMYLSLIVDRRDRKPVFLAAAQGGVDIEANAAAVTRTPINPLIGLKPHHVRGILDALGLPVTAREQGETVLRAIWFMYRDCGAELVEINPLMLVDKHGLVAADAKVVLDGKVEHALLPGKSTGSEAERLGVVLVPMGGQIAIVSGGAGSSMSMLDVVSKRGGRPAAFVDLGGIVSHEVGLAVKALQLVLAQSPSVILYNAFTQVTRCDTIAQSLIAAFGASLGQMDVVVRMRGFMSAEGRAMLSAAGFHVTESFDEACDLAVQLSTARKEHHVDPSR